MRKLLMPIVLTWALNRLADRYLHPQGTAQTGHGAARGYNPNLASEFLGSGLQSHTNRLKVALDAFRTAWKNYRE